MFIDYSYVVYVLPAVLFAMWASSHVNSTFRRYSTQYSMRNMTGYDAARRVLDANGLYSVRIERVSGSLTDHYDPRNNVIRLSDSVYHQTSTAAIGVHSICAELCAYQAAKCYYSRYKPGFQAGYAPDSNRTALCRFRFFYGHTGLCGCCLFRAFHPLSAFYAAHRI